MAIWGMKEVPVEVVEMMRVETVMEDACNLVHKDSRSSKRSLTINLNSQGRGVMMKRLIAASVV